ncbi:MAG: hypothetical protein LBC63_01420 [Holophagales bacterium]|nr:hypothetical protein [Holophagales bacterium]
MGIHRYWPLRGEIDAGYARVDFYAEWRRSAVMRCLDSGRAFFGLLRFVPGLGKAY